MQLQFMLGEEKLFLIKPWVAEGYKDNAGGPNTALSRVQFILTWMLSLFL